MKLRWDNQHVRWGVTSFLVIAASMLFYYGVFHMKTLITGIQTFLGILTPIVYGVVIAFLLTPVLNFLEKKIIYLKAEQSSYVNHEKIHIGDIASVFCEDKEIEKKIKNIVLYEFDEKNEKEGRVFLSILLLIEKISEQIPYGEVRNTGETDMVIYYKAEELKSKKWVQVIKILFICATCFFGAGITVMGYNNDVDMVKVFGQLYKVFLGTKPDDPTFVELFYSVGLALGIFLFFNHVPGKKVTNEPTPIQVQMRLYEQDVNRTFLLGASRKGEELDVSGNNDSANNK